MYAGQTETELTTRGRSAAESGAGGEPAEARSPSPPVAGRRKDSVLRRDLSVMLADGAFFSVMVGIGESYIPAFALALGMSELVGGLIATAPLLMGSVLQLISPSMVHRLGSYRRWIVFAVSTQALSFLPLIAAALWGYIPVVALFLCAGLYWGTGLAGGPAWNTWAESLVPKAIRPQYFSRRTRVVQAGTLIGFLGGGILLQMGDYVGHRLWAFALIFLVAAVCRVFSAASIARQSESRQPRDLDRRVPLSDLWQRIRHGRDGRLLVYLLSVYCAVQISGPLFAPFMLKVLQFSYMEYAALLAMTFVSRAIALPALGRVAQRHGAMRLMWIGAIGIIPLSGGWLLSQNYAWLLVLQSIGGVTWGAFELAMLLLFFEAIPTRDRTSMLTSYNLAYALANVTGTVLGCCLWRLLGEGMSAYLCIFALSSGARLAALLLLARVKDHRPLEVWSDVNELKSEPVSALQQKASDIVPQAAASVIVEVANACDLRPAGADAPAQSGETPDRGNAPPLLETLAGLVPPALPELIPPPLPQRRFSLGAIFTQWLR